jgi:hypothetical protein
MFPFMKLLAYVPGLVELVDQGYVFSIERVDTMEEKYRYQIGAKKGRDRKIIYAAPTLEEAVEKFVTNIDQYIKEKL